MRKLRSVATVSGPWGALRCVELSSGPVEYADEGEGPPVVLLHGLVMNHTQWDSVMARLPTGFRYIRPVLPLGGHRLPMRPDADLSLDGLVHLLAELLETLDLQSATLAHTDWGGGLFLTAKGLDSRVGRLVILPCEAFGNVPPGLPGHAARLAATVPGGLAVAARQLRSPLLRRSPLLLGPLAAHPVPQHVVEAWTDGLIRDRAVRRDLQRYLRSPIPTRRLRSDTEALRHFEGPALVAWGERSRIMPVRHGRALAALLPHGQYVEIPDARALPMLDNPRATAHALADFLTTTRPADREEPDDPHEERP